MSRLKIGVIRYGSAANAIARALGTHSPPVCRIGLGRITLTFRNTGASRWPEGRQLEYAIEAARIARDVLASDRRRGVRQRVGRAIVVRYEDVGIGRGCSVAARWECVVPAE